jgi:hypothetical protein
MQRRSRLIAPLIGLVLAGAGLAVVVWRKVLAPQRATPLDMEQRRERPIEIPREAQQDGLQLPADGVGPLYHRVYRADIAAATRSPAEVMREVQHNLAAFSPDALAKFDKAEDRPSMQVGDEYDITILGPWNGSVRVIDVQPTSFALVTLDGHPEAGEIRFELNPHPASADGLRFEIHSWARSRDAWVQVTYRDLKLGQQAQQNTWVVFCQRVAEASGGSLMGEVEVSTDEQPFRREVIAHE